MAKATAICLHRLHRAISIIEIDEEFQMHAYLSLGSTWRMAKVFILFQVLQISDFQFELMPLH